MKTKTNKKQDVIVIKDINDTIEIPMGQAKISPAVGSKVRYTHASSYWKDSRLYEDTGLIESIESRSYPWNSTPSYNYKIRNDATGRLETAFEILAIINYPNK